MEHKRTGFIISIMLLMLLSACQMGTATPPASVNCNQTGCPYPAICDLKSGVCTINQQQGPGAAAPQQPGAGIIANNQGGSISLAPTPIPEPTAPLIAKSPGGVGSIAANPGNSGPGSLLPQACNPPVPSISNINSFCANQTSKLGGVTYVGPADYNWAYTNNDYCDFTKIPKVTCSGPQNQKFQMEICQACGLPQPQALGAFVCSNGYVNDGQGNCLDTNPTDAANGINWVPCPSGTHYDNALQNCADDVTDKLASPCPPAYPYFIPDFHYCLAKAYPVVYNCQTFQLQLGDCTTPVKKIPGTGNQCPAGKTYKCTRNPLTGGQTCSCQ